MAESLPYIFVGHFSTKNTSSGHVWTHSTGYMPSCKKNHKQNPPKSNNKPLAIGHTFSALQEMFTPMQ
jgi:hypothetical protein